MSVEVILSSKQVELDQNSQAVLNLKATFATVAPSISALYKVSTPLTPGQSQFQEYNWGEAFFWSPSSQKLRWRHCFSQYKILGFPGWPSKNKDSSKLGLGWSSRKASPLQLILWTLRQFQATTRKRKKSYGGLYFSKIDEVISNQSLTPWSSLFY